MKDFDLAGGGARERNRPSGRGDFSLTSPLALDRLSASRLDDSYCHRNRVLLSLSALAPAGRSAILYLQNLISPKRLSDRA
jgi:hypothetical protein